jgi:hypothetical protein
VAFSSFFVSVGAPDGACLQMQYYVGCHEEVRYNKFVVFAGNGL